ncbi:MAG TPA: hydrolase, partial [Erysipelotrichaceae bacterium]|nr:hydrolase [Erysipelotrichaceae bacterium]
QINLMTLVHLLTYLKNHEDTCIVVSSSSYQDVRYALKKAGLDELFTCYVCGDQVEKTKPDPEIYLKALADYQIKKEEAVVLEDSINGIKAARAADIDVIGIPDLVAIDHLAGDHVAIYASLEDVFSQLSHDSFHLFEK